MLQKNKQIYLGSNSGNHLCDCHYTEDGCAEEEVQFNTCNCDANLPVELQDTGLETFKDYKSYSFIYFQE